MKPFRLISAPNDFNEGYIRYFCIETDKRADLGRFWAFPRLEFRYMTLLIVASALQPALLWFCVYRVNGMRFEPNLTQNLEGLWKRWRWEGVDRLQSKGLAQIPLNAGFRRSSKGLGVWGSFFFRAGSDFMALRDRFEPWPENTPRGHFLSRKIC